jgi:hypothetical protein
MGQMLAIKLPQSWRAPTGFVSALLAVLLPKCPLCFMAYAGVLGISGVDLSAYGFWLLPIAVAFSLFTITIFFFQAKRNKRYLPFGLAAAAIILILSDKFFLGTGWAALAAIFGLLVLSVWLSVPRQTAKNNCTC